MCQEDISVIGHVCPLIYTGDPFAPLPTYIYVTTKNLDDLITMVQCVNEKVNR